MRTSHRKCRKAYIFIDILMAISAMAIFVGSFTAFIRAQRLVSPLALQSAMGSRSAATLMELAVNNQEILQISEKTGKTLLEGLIPAGYSADISPLTDDLLRLQIEVSRQIDRNTEAEPLRFGVLLGTSPEEAQHE